MKIKRSEEIENRSEREKRVQNPGMKYHGFVLHQNPGTENSGKDRGSVAYRDAEARSRPRTTAESLTQPPLLTVTMLLKIMADGGPPKT